MEALATLAILVLPCLILLAAERRPFLWLFRAAEMRLWWHIRRLRGKKASCRRFTRR